MLLFAHSGITLGATVLLSGALTRLRQEPPSLTAGNRFEGWVKCLAKRVDLRLLLIGSLLPDIIDKPLGMVVFRDTFSNGRIFAHTLLFLLFLSLVGWYVYYKYLGNALLIISWGTLWHFLLDGMWVSQKTLFWPLFGFSFGTIDISRWGSTIWNELLHQPAVYLPEILGVVILFCFVWVLLRQHRVFEFLKHGRIG